MDLSSKRIMLTGGAGFLGSFVTEKLKARGCKDIFIPTEDKYDLTKAEAIERAFKDFRPDVVIHLAAKVGGIGANRENPGSFFCDEAMPVPHKRYAHQAAKEEDLWNGYPKKPRPPTAWPKRCSWCSPRPTAGRAGHFYLPPPRHFKNPYKSVSTCCFWSYYMLCYVAYG